MQTDLYSYIVSLHDGLRSVQRSNGTILNPVEDGVSDCHKQLSRHFKVISWISRWQLESRYIVQEGVDT